MFDNMTKFQLRAACRTAGIKNASKMTNDQMREALAQRQRDEQIADKSVAAVQATVAAMTDVPAGTLIQATLYGRDCEAVTTEHDRAVMNQMLSEVSGDLYARAGRDNIRLNNQSEMTMPPVIAAGTEEIEALIPPVINAHWKRQRDWQRVEHNTPPRNRKGRGVPSRMRTASRRERHSYRQAHLKPSQASA